MFIFLHFDILEMNLLISNLEFTLLYLKFASYLNLYVKYVFATLTLVVISSMIKIRVNIF